MSMLKAVVLPVMAFVGALLVSGMEGDFAPLARGLYAVSMLGLIAYAASRPHRDGTSTSSR